MVQEDLMHRNATRLFVFLIVVCCLFAGDVLAQSTDFNGDGKSDMLWRNGNDGRNIVWLMTPEM